MNGKKVVMWSLGVGLVAVGAYVVWAARGPAIPAPANQTPGAIIQYIASSEFQEVAAEKKDDYFRSAADRFSNPAEAMAAVSNLSDEERQRLMQNAGPLFHHVMSRQVEVFFKLPPEERDAYLDKMIDAMRDQRQAMMSRDRSSTDPPPRRPWGGGRGFSLKGYKWMAEHIPPEDLARFMEFGKAMAQRMAERAKQGSAAETRD